MTDSEKALDLAGEIRGFVWALSAARKHISRVQTVHREAGDDLLERWYEHSRKWVKPYKGPEGYGYPRDVPAFQPTWADLDLDESDEDILHFSRYQYDERDHVYVDTDYFLDPDAWEAEDKKKKVTKETWHIQRARFLNQRTEDHKAAQLGKAIEELKAAGYRIEAP
jgi:hypothetical protein